MPSDLVHEPDALMETALLLVVPEAEPAVHRHRARYDLAAQVGVPAHLTVAYPFKPTQVLGARDVDRVRELFAATPSFALDLTSTGWFGSDVLYLRPADPEPVVRLTRLVEAAFPDYPVYGGAYEELHPHLTVAHGCPADVLQNIERQVQHALPISHRATEVELWSGPALTARQPGWNRVGRFALA